jgi:hypothetical protein
MSMSASVRVIFQVNRFGRRPQPGAALDGRMSTTLAHQAVAFGGEVR